MRSSCIRHPTNEPLILIRRWQIKACNNNQCAAALLSHLEYWHDIRLEQQKKAQEQNRISEMHGEKGTQDISLYQFHTEKELEEGILIFRKDAMKDAIKILIEKEFISVHKNPNPRYHFDKTRHFIFHADKVQDWLDNQYEPISNPNASSDLSVERKTVLASKENRSRGAENLPAIHKTTKRDIKEGVNTAQQNFSDLSQKPKAINFQLPEFLQPELLQKWIDYRWKNGNPLFDNQIESLILILEERVRAGEKVDIIINTAIAEGWRGLGDPKPPKPITTDFKKKYESSSERDQRIRKETKKRIQELTGDNNMKSV